MSDALALLLAVAFFAVIGFASFGFLQAVFWLCDRWDNRVSERKRRQWLATPEGQCLRSGMRAAQVRFLRAYIKAGK